MPVDPELSPSEEDPWIPAQQYSNELKVECRKGSSARWSQVQLPKACKFGHTLLTGKWRQVCGYDAGIAGQLAFLCFRCPTRSRFNLITDQPSIPAEQLDSIEKIRERDAQDAADEPATPKRKRAKKPPTPIADRTIKQEPVYTLDRVIKQEPIHAVDRVVKQEPIHALDRTIKQEPVHAVDRAAKKVPRHRAEESAKHPSKATPRQALGMRTDFNAHTTPSSPAPKKNSKKASKKAIPKSSTKRPRQDDSDSDILDIYDGFYDPSRDAKQTDKRGQGKGKQVKRRRLRDASDSDVIEISDGPCGLAREVGQGGPRVKRRQLDKSKGPSRAQGSHANPYVLISDHEEFVQGSSSTAVIELSDSEYDGQEVDRLV